MGAQTCQAATIPVIDRRSSVRVGGAGPLVARRRKKSARRRRGASSAGPRFVWVSTDKGLVWRDDQGTDRHLPSAEELRVELRKAQLAEAERERLEAEQQRQEIEALAPIRFKCPLCGKQISVPVEKAGQKGACPKCKSSMIVPAKRLTPQSASYVECLDCGAPQELSTGVCVDCQKPLPVERTCCKCGDLLVRPGVQFCPSCGFELSERE